MDNSKEICITEECSWPIRSKEDPSPVPVEYEESVGNESKWDDSIDDPCLGELLRVDGVEEGVEEWGNVGQLNCDCQVRG